MLIGLRMQSVRHFGRWVSALFAAALLPGALAVAGEVKSAPPEIEYASPDQSVWTTRVAADGSPGNPLLHVAEALFARAGMTWRARTYPAARMFMRLQDGQSHFSMLVRAPALADCCLLSAKPFTNVEIRAYRRLGMPAVRNKEDLAGRSVILIRGYSYGGLAAYFNDARAGIVTHITTSHVSAVRMLEAGRADYLIDYAGPVGEVLAAESIRGVTSDLLSRQDVYLVLSKQYPNAEAVMARLETILATLDVAALMRREP